MAQNKPKSIKEAHAQGSMYYWDKNGNKQLAVTAKQLAAFKKSDLYDPDSKKGALTQWANAAKKQGVEAVVPALKAGKEAEEKRKAEIKEAKRQAELKKRQKLEAGRLAEQKRKVELQESKRQAELQQRQEVERQRIEAEKKDPIEEFVVQHEKAASHADKFERAIGYLMPNEGGYNSEEDTKYGISKATYPELDIENLSMAQAIEIYRKDWWQPYKDLPGPIAIKMFDTAVNVGHHEAGHWLRDATAEAGEDNIEGIVRGIGARQLTHYQGLSNWEENKGGWTARANRIPELAGPPEIDEAKTRNEIKELRDNKIPAHKIINMRSRMNERRYGVRPADVNAELETHHSATQGPDAWDPDAPQGDITQKFLWAAREIHTIENMFTDHGRGAEGPLQFLMDFIPTMSDLFLLDKKLPYPMEAQPNAVLLGPDQPGGPRYTMPDDAWVRRFQGMYQGWGQQPGWQQTAEGFFEGQDMGGSEQYTGDTDVVAEYGKITLTSDADDTDMFHEVIHKIFTDLSDQGYLTRQQVDQYRKKEHDGVSMEHAFIDWLSANYATASAGKNGPYPHHISDWRKNKYNEKVMKWMTSEYPDEELGEEEFATPTQQEFFKPILDMLNESSRRRSVDLRSGPVASAMHP